MRLEPAAAVVDRYATRNVTLGGAKIRRGVRRAGVDAREKFLSDLEPGELVVHVDHGIGRYHGLVRIADRVSGIEREYIDIEYAEGGRLRVPAEHADRVGGARQEQKRPATCSAGSGVRGRARDFDRCTDSGHRSCTHLDRVEAGNGHRERVDRRP